MQREEDGGVVISCDFTGTDWDEHIAMIEGHKGSVICLEGLALAIDGAAETAENFRCTMCIRAFKAPERAWRHPEPPPGANPAAVICWDCIQQADRAFAKDPDTEWQRKIEPSDRWR